MPEPIRVVSEPPTLDSNVHGYWLTALFSIALRTLFAWVIIAILIPQFGITYWMVYLGIVGVNAVRGPEPYALAHAANRLARSRRSSSDITPSVEANDRATLIARSMV